LALIGLVLGVVVAVREWELTPADSAKFFEFCVFADLLNGLTNEAIGTTAPR
jgi:hypothetical protein